MSLRPGRSRMQKGKKHPAKKNMPDRDAAPVLPEDHFRTVMARRATRKPASPSAEPRKAALREGVAPSIEPIAAPCA